MDPIRVTIIILNWNRPQDTLNCLESLVTNSICEPSSIEAGLHQGDTLETKLLVVDNGSTDDSVAAVGHAYPAVEIMELERNLGFAAGMNRGIQNALEQGADYVLLLNNDTLVAPKFVVHMVECMENDIGLVAPFIYYVEPPDELWHNFQEPIVCDAATGCALLIKRTVMEEIGLFDEQFFMYYEDVDFCLRAIDNGYRTVVTPHAKVWHHVSQSSGGSHSPAARFYMALSCGRYFRKWMYLWQTPLIIPYRLLSVLRWTLRLARNGRWQALWAYWRGVCYGWLGDPKKSYSI